MVRASYLVLILVGCSQIGEKVGWGVATLRPLCSLFVLWLLARARYEYDGSVSL